ncbi:MAG: AAA family ATPase [Lachnospiraceae bacterium]|nr:AAA family ATPase [Lachnospiraceae bacterium]
MRLLRCYVENFGGISDFEYDFSKNLNIINEENGWGKTTFAVFIKSMFYGMETSTKRKIDENERKKYTPWNGQRFGGNIEFEVNGNEYRVERYFGKRDRDDYFALINLKTNLESDDFTENLGEEIFKIDKEAFERSIYIPQQKISVETNDSLSAKLTNIMESDYDINRFENAIARLDDASKVFKKKKGDKGRLFDLEEEVKFTKRELEDCKSYEKSYEELEEMVKKQSKARENLSGILEKIEDNIKNVASFAENNAKKAYYDQLCTEFIEKDKLLQEAEDFFKNGTPEISEVISYEEKAKQLASYRIALMQSVVSNDERNEYEDLKNVFSNGIPEDSKFLECEAAIDRISKLDGDIKAHSLTTEEEREYNSLNYIFAREGDFQRVIDDNTDKYKRYVDIGAEIERENSSLIGLESWRDNNAKDEERAIPITRLEIYIALTGVIAMIIGIILMASKSPKAGSIFIGISISALSALVLVYTRRRWVSPELEELIAKNEEDILNTRRNINNLEIEKKTISNELSDFADKFQESTKMNYMMGSLSSISSKYDNYLNVANKKRFNDSKLTGLLGEFEKNVNIVEGLIDKYADKIGYVKDENEGYIRKDVINNSDTKKIDNKFGKKYNLWKNNKDSIKDMKWRDVLRVIKDKKDRFVKLNNRVDEYERNYNLMNSLEPEIGLFVRKYFDNINPNAYEDYLTTIKNKLNDMKKVETDHHTLYEKLNKFKQENDMDKLMANPDNFASMEELQAERNRILAQMNQVRDDYDILKNRYNEYGDIVAKRPELETQLERAKNNLSEAEHKYDILIKTKSFLEKAKEEFSARYLTGLNNGFVKYVKILSGEFPEGDMTKQCLKSASLDTSLNVHIKAYGTTKSVEYLSTGSRDLLGICSRLALVDAMYEGEKPFIILDDPFVNLDEEKILNALIFLEQISSDYQIIYFACHPSRVV